MENSTENGAVAISQRHSSFQAPMVVSNIADNCLYSGFFGRLDSARVKTITDKMLQSLDQLSVDTIIIDLSNIDVIDSLVSNHLVNISATLRLVGVRAIFCGISPIVAQTMVGTGVDSQNLTTVRDLKTALSIVNENHGAEHCT